MPGNSIFRRNGAGRRNAMVLFVTMFPIFATGGPGVPGGFFFQGTGGGPRSVMILFIEMLLLPRFRVWRARGLNIG